VESRGCDKTGDVKSRTAVTGSKTWGGENKGFDEHMRHGGTPCGQVDGDVGVR